MNNLLSTSKKVSPVATTEAMMSVKKPTTSEKIQAPTQVDNKSMDSPATVDRSTKKASTEDATAAPIRQPKTIHKHRKSIGTKGRPSPVSAVADRLALLQREEKLSARKLRQIKRRLFLEAVGKQEPPTRIKSPRNSIRLQEGTGKKNRTAKE